MKNTVIKMIIFIISMLFYQMSSAQTYEDGPKMVCSPQVAAQQLKKFKFSKKFTQDLLKNYDCDSFHNVARLNILGFLSAPNHHDLLTDEATIKTEEFVLQNKKFLSAIEKRYQVTGAVIASLLWIETRHGQLTGRYHVGSVYLHMLQLTRPEAVKGLTQLGLKHETTLNDKKLKRRLPKLVKERTARKSKWALEQLKALEKIHKRNSVLVNDLKGSFAGAFGIPQFIPTSYVTYARGYRPGTVPDLYKVEDAITSVGSYLKKEGFRKKSKKSQLKALMHYNNSKDYAEAILELSRRLLTTTKNTSIPTKPNQVVDNN